MTGRVENAVRESVSPGEPLATPTGRGRELLFLPEFTRPQAGLGLTLMVFCKSRHRHRWQREGAPGLAGLDVPVGPYGVPHIDMRGQGRVSVQVDVIPPKSPRFFGAQPDQKAQDYIGVLLRRRDQCHRLLERERS